MKIWGNVKSDDVSILFGIPQVQRRENQSPNKVIFYGLPTQVSVW